MAKFKPRSVEAQQLTYDPSKDEGKRTNAEKLAEWCGGEATWVTQTSGARVPQVVVSSRTGTKVANPGDYVVELSEGNYTVMTERTFNETYEK